MSIFLAFFLATFVFFPQYDGHRARLPIRSEIGVSDLSRQATRCVAVKPRLPQTAKISRRHVRVRASGLHQASGIIAHRTLSFTHAAT